MRIIDFFDKGAALYPENIAFLNWVKKTPSLFAQTDLTAKPNSILSCVPGVCPVAYRHGTN